jgi:hypothetical protein
MKHIIILLATLSILACKNDEKISYPHTEHEIISIGFKSGLISSSSDQDFENALFEIIEKFENEGANPTTETTFDGVKYYIDSIRDITDEADVPNIVWEDFWEDLFKREYAIGSCWQFAHIHLPSKGETGSLYGIYAIVKNEDGEVRYSAFQGNLTPRKTHSNSDAQNPARFTIDSKPHYFNTKRIAQRE